MNSLVKYLQHRNWKIFILLIIPILGSIYVLQANRFGIGVTPDSTIYISSAESYSKTHEFRTILKGPEMEYLSHYPPGYPFSLYLVNLIVHDFYLAAVVINAFALAALLWAVGRYSMRFMNQEQILLVQLMILFNIQFVDIYAMAWSEPLYFLSSFIGLVFLADFIETKQLKWLYSAALAMAVSCSLRYVGITLVITGSFALWFFQKEVNARRRIFQMLQFAFVSSFILIYWFVRNWILMNNPANRKFEFHPISLEYYNDLLSNTFKYFFSFNIDSITTIFIGGVLLFLLFYFLFKVFKMQKSNGKIWILYFWVYFAFLYFSNTFLDFTPYYNRTLAPIFFFIPMIAFLNSQHSKRWVIGLIYVLLILIPFTKVNARRCDGMEYNSAIYRIPSTIQALQNLEKNSVKYSNEPDRIYFLTGEVCYWLDQFEAIDSTGNCYMILFKNGRKYDPEFWNKSGKLWNEVFESSDVTIKRMDQGN